MRVVQVSEHLPLVPVHLPLEAVDEGRTIARVAVARGSLKKQNVVKVIGNCIHPASLCVLYTNLFDVSREVQEVLLPLSQRVIGQGSGVGLRELCWVGVVMASVGRPVGVVLGLASSAFPAFTRSLEKGTRS